MFDNTRTRGHRIAGPVPQYREERHWVLAAIGVAIAVIGAGVSAYAASEQAAASRQQAKAQSKLLAQQADQERQLDERRQKLADQQAQSEIDASEFEEAQFRRRVRVLIGKQIAESSSLGIDITSGSPLLLEVDTVKQAELEALNIRRIGQRTAHATRVGAETEGFRSAALISSTQFESALAQSRASAAGRQGTISTIGATVGGAQSVLRTFVKPAKA